MLRFLVVVVAITACTVASLHAAQPTGVVLPNLWVPSAQTAAGRR